MKFNYYIIIALITIAQTQCSDIVSRFKRSFKSNGKEQENELLLDSLRRQIQHMRKEITNIRSLVKTEQSDQLSKIHTDIAVLNTRFYHLDDEIRNLRNEVGITLSQKRRHPVRSHNDRHNFDSIANDFTQLSARIKNVEMNSERMDERQTNIHRQMDALTSNISAMHNRSHQSIIKVDQLAALVTEMKKTHEGVTNKLFYNQQSNETLEERVTQCEEATRNIHTSVTHQFSYIRDLSERVNVVTHQAQRSHEFNIRLRHFRLALDDIGASSAANDIKLTAEIAGINQTIIDLTHRLDVCEQLPKRIQALENDIPDVCNADEVNSFKIIRANSRDSQSFKVRCQKDGWMAIQWRFSSRVDFNRSWSEYEFGFGNEEAGWSGLAGVHDYTNMYDVQLKVETWDLILNYRSIVYDQFSIGAKNDGYKLQVGTQIAGNLTDSLRLHNGAKFSTPEQDQDQSMTNCARYHSTGWWYHHCQDVNLNGNFYIGMVWRLNKADWLHIHQTQMLIRRV